MTDLFPVVLPIAAVAEVLRRRLPGTVAVQPRGEGPAPMDRAGAAVRHAVERAPIPTAASALRILDNRRLALVTAAAAASTLLRWWLPIVIVAAALLLGSVSSKRDVQRRAAALADAVPLLIDLVRAGVMTGASPRGTLLALGSAPLPGGLSALQPVLARVARDLGDGLGFDVAVDGLASAHESLRPFTDALRSSERLGVAVGPALDVLAIDARLARRRRAEARARRLPVLLLFPLVLCTLPAFALLTVIPLLLSGFSSVRW